MEPNDDTNLTEKLFTRIKQVLETSEISNSSPVDEQDSSLAESFIDGDWDTPDLTALLRLCIAPTRWATITACRNGSPVLLASMCMATNRVIMCRIYTPSPAGLIKHRP